MLHWAITYGPHWKSLIPLAKVGVRWELGLGEVAFVQDVHMCFVQMFLRSIYWVTENENEWGSKPNRSAAIKSFVRQWHLWDPKSLVTCNPSTQLTQQKLLLKHLPVKTTLLYMLILKIKGLQLNNVTQAGIRKFSSTNKTLINVKKTWAL